jgi:hypothetical protein
MDPSIIAALIPLGEKLLGGLASGLGEASPGQKNALSELLGGLVGKISGTGQAATTAPAAGLDSQILQAIQALATGHTIELDMTLKARPKGA